jgi:NADH-quinone oxidoreductase subunit H
MMGEFLQVVIIGGLVTALFLGGWSIPYLHDADLIAFLAKGLGPNLANLFAMVIHVVVFFTKVIVLIAFQMSLRWGLPRFRYDQVMHLGWRIMLPLSLANIIVTGAGILWIEGLMS